MELKNHTGANPESEARSRAYILEKETERSLKDRK